ncbi:hypothetical protein PF002_g24799 [Phytophthora fragariae]|uniref:Secreted protein n=1 Tax=Phytophthora fragariae TaxID=53985 RepID=A0A6A3WT61_9STRA|nr:hypothetical protein PF002_g24799 [Phytophthora fragariae]
MRLRHSHPFAWWLWFRGPTGALSFPVRVHPRAVAALCSLLSTRRCRWSFCRRRHRRLVFFRSASCCRHSLVAADFLISSRIAKGLAISSSRATSLSWATLLPSPLSWSSVYWHLAIVWPTFPHWRHCNRCRTAGCFSTSDRPYHIKRTIPLRNSGHSAVFIVRRQTVEVSDSGVHVSMASNSMSALM